MRNQFNSALQNESIDRSSKQKKFCRFKKSGIKYIDYKDPNFLKQFINDQGKILPRRITGTSLKYQRKVTQAIKALRKKILQKTTLPCLDCAGRAVGMGRIILEKKVRFKNALVKGISKYKPTIILSSVKNSFHCQIC